MPIYAAASVDTEREYPVFMGLHLRARPESESSTDAAGHFQESVGLHPIGAIVKIDFSVAAGINGCINFMCHVSWELCLIGYWKRRNASGRNTGLRQRSSCVSGKGSQYLGRRLLWILREIILAATVSDHIFDTTAVYTQIMKFAITEAIQFIDSAFDLLFCGSGFGALTPGPFADTGAQQLPGVAMPFDPFMAHG
jgi:hypothetical protein